MATQNYFKAKNGLEAPSQSTIAVTDSSFPTVRPTLNLDFAGSESVDSRITFTRASTATYYGADGKLAYAAQNEPRIEYDPATGECKGLLIEEQRTNLTQYSNHFKPGYYWQLNYSNTLATIEPNYAIGPDGLMSATRMTKKTDGNCGIFNGSLTVTNGSVYTSSIYAKYNGNANILWLVNVNAAAGADSTSFNIQTGVIVSNGSNNTARIVDVGNGWYRCSVTATATTTTPAYEWCYFDGSIGNSILIYGYQREVGSFPTSYIPSTTTFTSRASSATYLDSTGTLRIAGVNQARYGYGYDSTLGKWVSQGLLLESASTNYWLESTKITAWLSTTVTLNYASAPDGSISAWKAVMTNYNGGAQNAGASNSNAGTLTGRTFTYSVWLKSESGTVNMIISIGRDSMNPTVEKTVSVDTTWRRYEVTATFTGGTSWFAGINTAGSGQAATVVGWGSQVEEAYAATSYIPTYNASATRAADVSSSASSTRAQDYQYISGSNFTSWFKADEGTIYAESSAAYVATANRVVSLNNGTTTNHISIINYAGSLGLIDVNAVRNTSLTSSNSPVNNVYSKTAFAYQLNSSSLSNNGAASVTAATSALPTNVNIMTIGSQVNGVTPLNGYIKKISYYPKRLSDAQLQALTA